MADNKDLSRLIRTYLKELHKIASDEDATDELSLRPALVLFFEGLQKSFKKDNLRIISEPKRKDFGVPDFKIKDSKGYLIGYIEAKGIGDDLEKRKETRQINKYRESGKRFILTNHLEFMLFDYGNDGRTILPLDTARLISQTEFEANKQAAPTDIDAFCKLFERFLKKAKPDINTPKQLAKHLATSARHLCDDLRIAFDEEGEKGDLHTLQQAFQEILIPDLAKGQFTDMYAQTLTYGLFAAAVNHQGTELLTLDNAWHEIPKTNKFLRKLFESVTGSALEDKPYRWIIEDLVDLFNVLDMAAILEGFGKRSTGQDPIIHFYEDFLAEYDPQLRGKRGVYYTPEPIVSFIVRSVDHLLRKRFDCPEGLADRQKVNYTVKRGDNGEERESHKVLVLDPACGTGTFLYFVIDLIRQRFQERGEAGMWSDYVRTHLLPRIFGFELLMAPYAMAHLKLGLQLSGLDLLKENRPNWSYDFRDDERLNVYLTNTLEEPRPRHPTLLPGVTQALVDEANAALRVKRDDPILCVLGNPPYKGISSNNGEWILDLLRGNLYLDGKNISVENYYTVDGHPLRERKVWIGDDYVKFLRWAQFRIEQTGQGIVAFITNHGYLDNRTLRGMREKLLLSFNKIYIINLHGNGKRQEKVPEEIQTELEIGELDNNVFDIWEVGTCIGIFIKETGKNPCDYASVYYQDLWGTRDRKEKWLHDNDWVSISQDWITLKPQSPYYFFSPANNSLQNEYDDYWRLEEVLPLHSTAIQTSRDYFVIDFEKEELLKRLKILADDDWTTDKIRDVFFDGKGTSDFPDGDSGFWKLEDARTRAKEDIKHGKLLRNIQYRPFDTRAIVFADWLIHRPRKEVMRNMVNSNLSLLVSGQLSRLGFRHVFCSNLISEMCVVSSNTKEQNYAFPLYQYPTQLESEANDLVARSRISEKLRKNIIKSGATPDTQADLERLVQELFPKSGYEKFPNFHPYFISACKYRLGLNFIPVGLGDVETTFGPEDIFHYIYAIFHSPTYRERYKEFLKIDFPRVPMTSELDLFRKMSQEGADLVALHLLKPNYKAASWNNDKAITNPFHDIQIRYPIPGDNVVEKAHPKYVAPGEKVKGEDEPIEQGRVYISESKPAKGKQGQYFDGISPEVWVFQIGGHQVCHKWLKDRQGRELSYDDREHYKKIIIALGKTIRSMGEIDRAIDEQGGWPL